MGMGRLEETHTLDEGKDNKARIIQIIRDLEAKNEFLEEQLRERDAQIAELQRISSSSCTREQKSGTLNTIGEQLLVEFEGIKHVEQVSSEGVSNPELFSDLNYIHKFVQRLTSFQEIVALGLIPPLETVLAKVRSCVSVVSAGKAGVPCETESCLDDNECTDTEKLNVDIADDATFLSFLKSNCMERRPSLLDRLRLYESDESTQTGTPQRDGNVRGMLTATWLVPFEFAFQNWNVDMLQLHTASGGRSVEGIGTVVLRSLDTIVSGHGVEAPSGLLSEISASYLDQPYHNAAHAAQTCQAASWLARFTGLSTSGRGVASLSLIIAALCHDVQHFGRNNAFLINSDHELAVFYNDVHVLENMHSALCFKILRGERGRGFLQNLTSLDYRTLRSHIIELILSTDMTQHFVLLSQFRKRRSRMFFDSTDGASLRLVSQMCLKAADLSHSALSWNVHHTWAHRITQEFFAQGDEESSLGLPISPLCSREAFTAASFRSSQKYFLQIVCLPVFEELVLYSLQENRESGTSFFSNGSSEFIDSINFDNSGPVSNAVSVKNSEDPRHIFRSEPAQARHVVKKVSNNFDKLQCAYVRNAIQQRCVESVQSNIASWDSDATVAVHYVEKLLGKS
eukprot:TRINITY_DN20692_c0_g1_i1.p1 TRINITY_DN20692_c0_g1~~TRINITY_DN20692_c0_g1_i1.p1  ORF type:complete len:627 (-),score=56.26 TRINITY_DN20692_c0_g1_i1:307-2187(-)